MPARKKTRAALRKPQRRSQRILKRDPKRMPKRKLKLSQMVGRAQAKWEVFHGREAAARRAAEASIKSEKASPRSAKTAEGIEMPPHTMKGRATQSIKQPSQAESIIAPAAPVAPVAPVATDDDHRKYPAKPTSSHSNEDNSKRQRIPPGTVFQRSDNQGFNESLLIVGKPEPERLVFSLRSTLGRSFQFHYSQRSNIDWNNPDDVGKANKWKYQIIKNTINKGDHVVKAPRTPWTLKEKESLRTLIKAKLRRTKKQLTADDWTEITKKHNMAFKGKALPVGEPLASPRVGKKIPKSVTVYSRALPDRTVKSVRGMVYKWPDMVQMMGEILDTYKPKCK